jgi:hypothetical protein
VTAVLRSIPKEAFADSFQKLYERCQPCAMKNDYFERVTAVLRSIPKEAFADSFQKLYERCQPCAMKNDYFERVTAVLLLFHSIHLLNSG